MAHSSSVIKLRMAFPEIKILSDSTTESEPAVAELAKNTNTETIDNFFDASAYGDLEKLRKFVEQDGVSLSSTDCNGGYALHWAASNNFPEIAQYIVERGGDVNAVDNIQQTALHWAAEEGSISVADVLLQNGAQVEAANVNGLRAVHVAAYYGQTSFLNHIVAKHDADFDVPDNEGMSPLQWAALRNFPEIVQLLIEHGGDVNAVDNSQRTALHCAAREGWISVADVLLQNGARVEAADVDGNRAVHITAKYGQTSFLDHIVAKHNADFDVADNNGMSPLHWAASEGYIDIVRWLLSRHASQKRQDKDGRTPLHWAAINVEMEVCKVLIDAGTKQEIWLKDNEGNTPFQLASAKSHSQGALLLSNTLQAECKHLQNSNLKGKDLEKGTNWPMIIAMQGDAYTGKSLLAKMLAGRLKCPVISLDDFLDNSERTHELDTLISHTFNIIAQIVKTQISLGLSVIVDSPLSRLMHLQKLVALLSTENTHNTRLVIIECKPKTEYAFQLRFEECGSVIYAGSWYKPTMMWPLPKLPRDYTDDDIPPGVSKLVLDTTDNYMVCQVIRIMLDVTSCGYGHITKYSDYLFYIHKDNSEQFTCPHCNANNLGTISDKIHKLTFYQGIHQCDKLCGVCDNQVLGSCYTCRDCPLTLHESCAELALGDKKHFVPQSFPIYMLSDPHLMYAFPVERPCAQCRKGGNGFSPKCKHCLFESHLKSRLLPTVVRHRAHNNRKYGNDFLTFWLNSDVDGNTHNYTCLACKIDGRFSTYVLDTHRMYHPSCLLLPPSVQHTHGGHTHDLEMVIHREEEMEDYMCDCCLKKMDPTAWYYYCSTCIVSVHLECAFKDFDSGKDITEA